VHLLRDIAQALADQENADLARIRIGSDDVGSPDKSELTAGARPSLFSAWQSRNSQGNSANARQSLVGRCVDFMGRRSAVKAKAAVRAEVFGWVSEMHGRPGRGPASPHHPERCSSRAVRVAARRGV